MGVDTSMEQGESGVTVNLDDKVREEEVKRPERLKKLTELTEELFPGEDLADLRQDIIERSFNVPQYGEFHTEGMFMDAHLAAILESLDELEQGRAPEAISGEQRLLMQELVRDNKKTFQMYALLHDISKADCLKLKMKDGTEKEITWEEWQSMAPDDAKTDPVKLKEFLDGQGITAIGYHHEDKKHGEEGAKKVADFEEKAGIPKHLLMAIDKHEVAYSFSKIAPKTYEKHLGSLTEEEKDWALTASYIDTSASVRMNGRPNLNNFLYLADTLHNVKIIGAVERTLRPDGKVPPELDARKVDKTLADLKNFASKISEDAEAISSRLYEECKFTAYDAEKLRQNLQPLVITGQLKQEVADELIATLRENGTVDEAKFKGVRGKLGAANKLITPILEASRR